MPKPPLLSVSGKAFARARESFTNTKKTRLSGSYGSGTQDWLADKTGLAIRTIQSLEKGKASLRTVDQVSNALSINGRSLIIGYGSKYTSIRSPGVIDFRSIVDGRKDSQYCEFPFTITIDPIIINYNDDFTDNVILEEISAKLYIDDFRINLKWLYIVELTPSSEGWLGYNSGVCSTLILKDQPYSKSIMLKQQDIEPVSWGDLLDCFMESKNEVLLLKVTLKFEFFNKIIEIKIPTENLKKNCLRAQKKYNLNYPHPYFIQLNALSY